MMQKIVLGCLLACGILPVHIASQPVRCVVDTATNGDMVKIRGSVFGGHDISARPIGCPDKPVILVYGDDQSLGSAKLAMRRDEAFRQFEKYLNEEQPPKANEICRQCARYRVTADFEGRLDIAPSAGFKRDSKTGKAIGIEGFGHPLPFTRYRLIVTRISGVEALELP